MSKPSGINGVFYDVIGDLHGFADSFVRLLLKMDYSLVGGVWTHSYRKAIFVGDIIDRGDKSREVVRIVKEMVEAGTAIAILGNHELNAIYYFTTNGEGEPLKIPSPANRRMLDRFKEEYKGAEKEFKEVIKWFRTLPLFIEREQFRVVHAYWNHSYIRFLKHKVHDEGGLRRRFLKKALRPDTIENEALWITLKGVEINLPEDLIIKDSKRIRRTNFRIKWWESAHGKTFKHMSYGNKFILPEYTIPEQIITPVELYNTHEKPVFIGHYCMGNGHLMPAPNVFCVDSCVAGRGVLGAYRWNGENELDLANYVTVKGE